MSPLRMAVGLLAMVLGAAVVGVLPVSPPATATAATADPAPPDSAVTKSGTGTFVNLNVTVSQTKNLINQAVKVSWTGGLATQPATGFGINYLQIMQCWGDDPAGPDRTQCQYGGLSSQISSNTGTWVTSRQVEAIPPDPEETLRLNSPSASAHVPFWAVGRPRPTGPSETDLNDFFDSQVTNEVPLARTNGDGTGEVFFEVETVVQAAGLGCGEPITADGTSKGRSCWLVVVPRGHTEVDGTVRNASNDVDQLNTSPLSQTNWDNRIVFPLDFRPVGQPCPIGAPERHVIGHELAVDAVTSWQPVLCAGGGALYSYVQLTDDITRNDVMDGSTPGLALMTNPVPPDQAPADHQLIYAPVALSGLAIAFNVDHQPQDAKPADLQLDGQRFQSMKLTPRLVAKLLTQSYGAAVNGNPDYLKNNPVDLLTDPEFLTLNPEYKGFANINTPVGDALVQLNGADVTSLLWSWIKANPEASAFLAGTPDNGMVINPNNKGLALPTATFPRNDQSCSPPHNGFDGICTLDTHPFTIDMHDAGRSTSRGDTQARTIGANNQVKKADRQAPGHQALLAVVDVATAQRYGLPTAALLNSAGQYVAPTTASLLAGEKAMKPGGIPGVLVSDPGTTDPAAYPLTALSYAVTSPSTLDAAARKDYAAFLRYAGGPGQQPGNQPGQLPPGLVPLPDALKAQTIAAAAMMESQPASTATGTAAQQPAATGVTTANPPGATSYPGRAAGPGTNSTNAIGGIPASTNAAPPQVNASTSNTPTLVQQPVAGVRRTPVPSIPAVGALFLITLVFGVLAAMFSPIMRPLGSWIGRRLEKGVRPTKQ